VLEVTACGRPPGPQGNRHPVMAPHGAFPCRGADHWCAIAVEDDARWQALCAIMERPTLGEDERFRTSAARKVHETTLEAIVSEWTSTQEAEAVMERLQAAGVAAGLVQDGRALVERDPQLRARGFYEAATHPVGGTFLHEGVVARLEATPGRVWHCAPRLGEHTREVLGGLLGLPDAEIDRLAALGALE
jgi:crotonobetainyl-CoA:carnitine CoA-transferase CaiB-like acyl-CoA transferase